MRRRDISSAPRRNPLRLLVFTTVFPNAAQPHHGVFVRTRMRALPPEVEVRVVAPVPWFPGTTGLRPGFRPAVPRREVQDGVVVEHPRFLSVPAFLKCLDGLFLFLSTIATLRRVRKEFPFRAIDAHFTYPDGFAAVLLGRLFAVPVLITERGTLPLVARHRLRRPQARWALSAAARLIAVAESLRREAAALGIAPARVRVIGNGVDAAHFRPLDRPAARRALGLTGPGPYLLGVGTLAERKGFDLLIEAVAALSPRWPDLTLLLVGGAGAEGFAGERLRRLAAERGVAARVVFAGPRDRAELPAFYSAADLFALPSALEGSPNVALEALACGTPVVATPTGELTDLLSGEKAGLLIPHRDAPAVTATIAAALSRPWPRQPIRALVAARTWEAVGRTVAEEIQAALAPTAPGATAAAPSYPDLLPVPRAAPPASPQGSSPGRLTRPLDDPAPLEAAP